ncbi:MAG: hypothetical protein J6M60_01855 [Clostridia bacterium]|nr:hypothetical protein [Clostridia bacterium]
MKKVLIIIAVLCIIWSFKIITQEQKYLDVTDDNKEIIYKDLEGKVNNVNLVNKIAVGHGWHTGNLYVYYPFGFYKKIPIYEGDNINGINGCMKQKGYTLEKNAKIVGGSAIIYIIIEIITYKIGNSYRHQEDKIHS